MSHARISLLSARTATAGFAFAALAAGTLGAGSAAAVGPSSPHVGRDVVTSVNALRATAGCKPVKVAKRLNRAAQGHANDIALTHVFSHTSADGRSWVTRLRAAGWKRPAGENIAWGFNSAPRVMTAWMNSPGHRRNILNCSFRYIGVGYSPVGNYWVQDFGY
jgi:uncharacterized protein YkwD